MIGTGTEPRVGSPDAAGAINHPRSTVALVCPTASRPSRSRSAKKPCAVEAWVSLARGREEAVRGGNTGALDDVGSGSGVERAGCARDYGRAAERAASCRHHRGNNPRSLNSCSRSQNCGRTKKQIEKNDEATVVPPGTPHRFTSEIGRRGTHYSVNGTLDASLQSVTSSSFSTLFRFLRSTTTTTK